MTTEFDVELEGIVYCAECGTANQAGAETCEVCGSPLEPPAGTRRCHACGSPVGELDRYCRACGVSISGAQAVGRYEPGPSFVNDENLTVDPSDLPPWLRELVSSTPEAASHSLGEPTPIAEPVDQSLPVWLRAPRPEEPERQPTATLPPPPAAASTAAPPVQPTQDRSAANESFSFISEDDLPEWLRALGDEDLDAPPAAAGSSPLRDLTAAAAEPAPAIPVVSRAWLTRARTIDPVHAQSAAGDFTPLEAPDRPASSGVQGAAVQETAAHAAIEQPTHEPGAQRSRGSRVWLLLLVLLLLVVIAGAAYVGLDYVQ